MSLPRLHRAALVMLASLFFALQSTAIAHAAQYGTDPHDHNGIVCTVDAVAADTDIIVPSAAVFETPHVTITPHYFSPFISAAIAAPPGRAPPPRSPPTLSF